MKQHRQRTATHSMRFKGANRKSQMRKSRIKAQVRLDQTKPLEPRLGGAAGSLQYSRCFSGKGVVPGDAKARAPAARRKGHNKKTRWRFHSTTHLNNGTRSPVASPTSPAEPEPPPAPKKPPSSASGAAAASPPGAACRAGSCPGSGWTTLMFREATSLAASATEPSTYVYFSFPPSSR